MVRLTKQVLLHCGRAMSRQLNDGRPQCQQQLALDADMQNVARYRRQQRGQKRRNEWR